MKKMSDKDKEMDEQKYNGMSQEKVGKGLILF